MVNITPSPLPIPVVTVKFIDGSEKGTTVHIHKPVTTIGHDLSKDIVVQGVSSAPEFARIIADNNTFRIEQRSQDLIVKVNNEIVIERATLHDGDTIDFGPVVAAFRFNNPYENNGGLPWQSDQAPPSSEPFLEVTSNTRQIRAKYTFPGTMQVINIGRSPSNDIVLDELFIDPFHLQVIRENGQLKLIHPHPDVTSTTNGLWYQDTYIPGTDPFEHLLKQGDIFHIKNEYGTRVTLTYDDGSGATQEKRRVSDVAIPLDGNQREILIGRELGCKVRLDHPSIARRHARVIKDRRGRHRIIDVSGIGNVYVNGRQIKNYLLKPGDEIRIGPYRLVYSNTEFKEYDERNSIRIDAYELKKTGDKQEDGKKKILLNGLSLAVEPGKFIALVGGSGAGKSTLMDALNGLRQAHEGKVYYNGQDYYRSLAAFRTQLGYVPQQDIVHQDLTVERALYYVAKLRLPNDLVQERIEKVLDAVSLEQRRNIMVYKLSGGQKKRVSIALELLAEPSIFFLDEPTSGLDPGLDRQMMDLLRDLAAQGHTIVLVTHATNNINVCDYVCFLCRDGRMAYFGPPQDAAAYFNKADFAEIYSYLEEPGIPEIEEQRFLNSPERQKYVSDVLKPQPAASNAKPAKKLPKRGSYLKQFYWLSLRYLELLRNDISNLRILLLQAPLIGLLLMGFIYAVGRDAFNPENILQCPTTTAIITPAGFPDSLSPPNRIASRSCQHVEDFLSNNPKGKAYASKRGGVRKALQDFIVPGTGYAPTVLFIMAFAAIMFGCINAAREFVKEVDIYRRERAVNLGIVPYMFSKIVVLGLLCCLQSLILVSLANIFDPFSHSVILAPFWEIYITVALTSLAGLMLGLMVSAWVSNSDRAMSIVPVLLLPQVIFSGAIFPLNSWPLQILAVFFPIRWAMAALGSSAGLHSDKLNSDQLFGDNNTYHGTLFSTYSQADATQYLWLMWLALSVMIVVFALAIEYLLKRKDTYK